MIFVELLDRGFQCEFTAGELQFLHQIGAAGKQYAPTVLNQGQADGGGEMAFAATRGTEQDQIGALIEPGVTGSDGHDLCFGEHGKELEVEVRIIEALCGG